MSQCIKFIIFIIYVISFSHLFNGKSLIGLLTFTLITIYYSISYFRLSDIAYNVNNVANKNMIQQRENFVNSLNHDLRIPIIAQLRALEFLNKESLGTLSSSQKDMISQIENSCRCTLNLLSLLINTYNIENNIYKLFYEKFNIYEIIIKCLNELQSEASEKNITFEYEGENKNLYISADKNEIRKVIFNLIATSIAFSNSGGKISILIKKHKNKILLSISVVDTNNISGCFCDTGNYSNIGNTIRILFCKKVIEIHKGKILKSKKENSFLFELPQNCISV